MTTIELLRNFRLQMPGIALAVLLVGGCTSGSVSTGNDGGNTGGSSK